MYTPFPTVFPLTLTFDFDKSAELRDPDGGRRFVGYGLPRFSEIPLERPPVAPEATDFRSTRESAEHRGSLWDHRASAMEVPRVDIGGDRSLDIIWSTQLSGREGTALAPTFSAEGFGRLLGQRGSFFRYNYSNEITGEEVDYVGFARLADATAPIPEPGTCILVGSALMGVWYRQRRKSNPRE